MKLYNTLSADERAKIIEEKGTNYITLSFYTYSHIQNPQQLRDELFIGWDALEILGRIYVSYEGINAQMMVPDYNYDKFLGFNEQYSFLQNLRMNVAVEHDNNSFLKLKIKVRDKIVADGLNDDSFDVTDIGTHLRAKDFNAMMDDPNTVVVDMRNHYESEVGYFEGAVKPDVDNFRESLPIIHDMLAEHKEDKNLLMYCTGGVRCEKASAYFKHKGFKNVYQLEGGIIEYTRQLKAEGLPSKFIGKNFVFDNRLGERITDDIVAQCHQCGRPCDTHTNCANDACHLLFIQCEECAEKMHNCCSSHCAEVSLLPEEEQKTLRKGIHKGAQVFKKGRFPHPLV